MLTLALEDMHDLADPLHAALIVPRLAVPNAPAQALDLLDDHRLCRDPCRIVGRQGAGDLLQVLQPHGDMKPVKDRQLADAGIGENAPKPGTTVGAGCQRRVLGPAGGVEGPADQHRDVRIRSGDGAENLATASLSFDVADPYLQMPLPILTAPDEGRVQGHHDRRRRHVRLGRGTIPKCLAGSQGATAQRPQRSRELTRVYSFELTHQRGWRMPRSEGMDRGV